jgi:hypothetical protein
MAFGRGFKREKGKKYNNTKVEYDGIKFDSKKEMQRYIVLKDAENSGVISNLELQVKYELIPAVREEYIEHLKTKDKVKTRTLQLPITYTCDFQYFKDGVLIVEDVKASPKMLPKEFVLKEKMMFALKGIKIKKVYSIKEEI